MSPEIIVGTASFVLGVVSMVVKRQPAGQKFFKEKFGEKWEKSLIVKCLDWPLIVAGLIVIWDGGILDKILDVLFVLGVYIYLELRKKSKEQKEVAAAKAADATKAADGDEAVVGATVGVAAAAAASHTTKSSDFGPDDDFPEVGDAELDTLDEELQEDGPDLVDDVESEPQAEVDDEPLDSEDEVETVVDHIADVVDESKRKQPEPIDEVEEASSGDSADNDSTSSDSSDSDE